MDKWIRVSQRTPKDQANVLVWAMGKSGVPGYVLACWDEDKPYWGVHCEEGRGGALENVEYWAELPPLPDDDEDWDGCASGWVELPVWLGSEGDESPELCDDIPGACSFPPPDLPVLAAVAQPDGSLWYHLVRRVGMNTYLDLEDDSLVEAVLFWAHLPPEPVDGGQIYANTPVTRADSNEWTRTLYAEPPCGGSYLAFVALPGRPPTMYVIERDVQGNYQLPEVEGLSRDQILCWMAPPIPPFSSIPMGLGELQQIASECDPESTWDIRTLRLIDEIMRLRAELAAWKRRLGY